MNTDTHLSRRSFVAAAGLAAAATTLAAPRRSLAGDQPAGDEGIVGRMRKQAADAKIAIQPLRGGVSVLSGAGGNIAVLSGPDGAALVDAGLSTARPQVRDAIATLTDGPIKYLVNTHWHFDHTDGNEWLAAQGALIVARENCRRRLASQTRVEAWGFTFPPAPMSALPVIDLTAEATLHINNATLALRAFEPAHTDTDLSVEFMEADVLHVGDTWWNGHYPFIDSSTGGSIDGMIRAAQANLSRATAHTIIIPGHGPVGSKAQLEAFHEMLVTVRRDVAAHKRQGRSLAEVIALKPTLDYDAQYGHFLMAPADFVGLVYAGV